MPRVSTSHALLALLERGPSYGYSLKQDYDERFARTRPLAVGQVYAALARFERHGWADIIDIEAGAGPDRKRYRITPEGVEVVADWVYTPTMPGEYTSSELFARVFVALMSGRSADEVLDRQREHHLARMRDLTRLRREADVAAGLAITFELNHLDADLRWIEEAGQRLGQLTTRAQEA